MPSVQIGQRQLYLKYREQMLSGELSSISETGFRVYSQFEEDGMLLFIFSVLGMSNKTFVEIGSDDGVNSNSANLYFNFGWRGLFIDGNPKSIKRGKRFFSKYPHSWFYPPKFLCAKVNRENVNQLIKSQGFEGEIGLLSIDIDGYDYWVWDVLEVISPQVVIIETHNEFGLEDIVVPYDPNYSYPGKHPLYHGASPIAMTKLAQKKGYRLVGANELGFNFIFVKNGLADDLIPEVSVESVLSHPSVWEGHKGFEDIKDWDYIRGDDSESI
ncbi:MAG: hypothetical protein MK086_02740 [Flavobacteriales bacterium]|nr:hypothetical protein [Flavobacteriales bacterium]